MSQGNDIQITVQDLITPALKATPAVVKRSVFRAGGDGIRTMRAEGVRQIRDRKAIKAGKLRADMTLSFPRNKEASLLRWGMKVPGDLARVSSFPHRQTKEGVTVQINKGKRAIIRHAFVAEMKSGHKGVFRRAGKKRLPIKEAFTTRPRDVFQNAGVTPEVQQRGIAVFRSSFLRNVSTDMARTRGVQR